MLKHFQNAHNIDLWKWPEDKERKTKTDSGYWTGATESGFTVTVEEYSVKTMG